MPLRGLLYFARQYEKYIAENDYNLYGTKRISIPTPQYVVFYNGNTWEEERKIWKLSDSFARNKEDGCIEVEVLQLNINYGHNKEIMEKCRPLWEYAVFIGKVKQYNEVLKIEDAVDRAVKECIQEKVLYEILIAHQGEVKDMLLTEYDEEKTMRQFRRDWGEELAEKIREVEEAAEKKVKVAGEKLRIANEEAKIARQRVKEMEEENKKMQARIEELDGRLEAVSREE